MKLIKKLTVSLLMLTFIILFSSAKASSIRDIFSGGKENQTVSFRIYPEAGMLPEFDELRVGQLNRILRHIQISGSVADDYTHASFILDGEELFSIREANASDPAGNGILIHCNGETYAVPVEMVRQETYLNTFGDIEFFFKRSLDIYSSLDTCRLFFERLPVNFPTFASSTKISAKYRNYGKAEKKTALSIQGDMLNEYIHQELGKNTSGGLYPNLAGLVFEGRQSFTLFYSESGSLIHIIYSGRAGYSNDDIRNVRLDWKTLRETGKERDEIELRTPSSKGSKRDNFLLTYIWDEDGEENEIFTWNAEFDRVSGGVRTRSFEKADISRKNHQYTGTFSDSISSRGKESSTNISVDCLSQEAGSYTGILEIVHKKDKIDIEKWNVHFDSSRIASVRDNSVIPRTDIEDDIGFVQYIPERMVSYITRRLLMLPADDLSFLKEGIPDHIWKEMIQDK